jgi:hypothetical protein
MIALSTVSPASSDSFVMISQFLMCSVVCYWEFWNGKEESGFPWTLCLGFPLFLPLALELGLRKLSSGVRCQRENRLK